MIIRMYNKIRINFKPINYYDDSFQIKFDKEDEYKEKLNYL